MKQTVDKYDFENAFKAHDRENQFSRAALDVLFDYYEDIDPDWELDVIAICCEWTEADSAQLISDYGYMVDGEDGTDTTAEDYDEEEHAEAVLNVIRDRTAVLDVPGETYLIQEF